MCPLYRHQTERNQKIKKKSKNQITNFVFFCLFFLNFIRKNFFGGFFLENFFLEEFFWRIFFGGFFWRIFFGRIFLEDFLGRNFLFTLLKSAKLFESERDWCFCQDFVSRQGRKKISILRSASASILHLKTEKVLNILLNCFTLEHCAFKTKQLTSVLRLVLKPNLIYPVF